MINSKALKPITKRPLMQECGCPEGDHGCGRVAKVFRSIGRFFLFNFYYPVESFFRCLKERTGRSLAWARFAYLNYDFDSAFLYDVMSFKLKRIYECLKHGYAIQEKEDMAALKEAIKICDRLHEDNYYDKYSKLHDKKWGRLPRFKMEPIKNEKGEVTSYRTVSKDRAKVKTDKQRKQERAEFRACWEKAEVDRRADIDRLAYLLKEHAPKWWD